MAAYLTLPDLTLGAPALLLVLLGLFFLILALIQIRRGRLFLAGLRSLFAVILLSAGIIFFLLGINLQTYQRLTFEQLIATLEFHNIGPKYYRVSLNQHPPQKYQTFELRGDEWQIDARVLKWKPPATLLGLDARYRLERLAGRYRDIQEERELPRTVHELPAPAGLDVWSVLGKLKNYAGWIDTYYGSASYMPMEDGARYEIILTQAGLIARPLNEAARNALRNWE